MEKQLSISQVREELGTLVDEVQYENSKYIILRHGKPAVASTCMRRGNRIESACLA